MQNHGPFTIGPDARGAVKAAVMCEDVARTVHIARQLGTPIPIAQRDVDSLFDRYQNVYGQERASRDPTPSLSARSGSSPAARTSTARTSLARSPSSRAQVVGRARRVGGHPGARRVAKPVLTDGDRDPRA